jgi:hypothetical protein
MEPNMKRKFFVYLTLSGLLAGCAHCQFGVPGRRQFDPHTPQLSIVDGGNGDFYAQVNQEPIVLIGSAINANFESLASAGKARRNDKGGTEVKLEWQLPADSRYVFNDPDDRDNPDNTNVPGIKIERVTPTPDSTDKRIQDSLISLTFRQCTRASSRNFYCWVSLDKAVEFKYSINLSSQKLRPIHVDPGGIIRPL